MKIQIHLQKAGQKPVFFCLKFPEAKNKLKNFIGFFVESK